MDKKNIANTDLFGNKKRQPMLASTPMPGVFGVFGITAKFDLITTCSNTLEENQALNRALKSILAREFRDNALDPLSFYEAHNLDDLYAALRASRRTPSCCIAPDLHGILRALCHLGIPYQGRRWCAVRLPFPVRANNKTAISVAICSGLPRAFHKVATVVAIDGDGVAIAFFWLSTWATGPQMEAWIGSAKSGTVVFTEFDFIPPLRWHELVLLWKGLKDCVSVPLALLGTNEA